MNRCIKKIATPYSVSIFICGEHNDILSVCQHFCDIVGLCVTVTPTTYVFTGGREPGFEIGLINYARFPKPHDQIWNTAIALAEQLKDELGQGSFTVQDNQTSLFVSTRDEDQLTH